MWPRRDRYARRGKDEGEHYLTFECGALPADAAVTAAGHEPNGYFWESIVMLLDEDLADRLDLDAEADMFTAYGSRRDVKRLQSRVEPLLRDPATVTALIQRAHAEGVALDD